LGRAREAALAAEKLGAALMNAAHYEDALAALDHALAAHQAANDLDGSLRVSARIGELHVLRGTPEEGIICLQAVLASLPGRTPSQSDLASIYVALAWLINATGRYGEALAVADQAARLARAAGETRLVVQADLRRGQLLIMLGGLQEGAQVLRDALPVAESLADLRSLRLALNSLGWVSEAMGDFEQDRALTERALETAERLGDPTVLAFMRSNHGGPAYNIGEWRQARIDFESGLASMRQLGTSWASAWPPLLLGRLELVEGHADMASRLLGEAVALAERAADLQALRWAHSALAEQELLAGRFVAARARLEPLLDRSGQQESDVVALLPLWAWTLYGLGETDAAEAVVAQAARRAEAARMRPALVDALRVQALLALPHDQTASGRTTVYSKSTRVLHQRLRGLDEACALCQAMQYPYGEAKVRYASAGAYASLGRHSQATAELA